MKDMSDDVFRFVVTETARLSAEYQRIQQRALADPGTAGDQGEENWAAILRRWLPAEFTVVTKGRILGHKGDASQQVDVIVLHPAYPPDLRDKKLYLAGGVAAVFECKLTLKASHVKDAIKNAATIKRLTPKRTGTP